MDKIIWDTFTKHGKSPIDKNKVSEWKKKNSGTKKKLKYKKYIVSKKQKHKHVADLLLIPHPLYLTLFLFRALPLKFF